MDFVNEPEKVLEAFRQYHTTAALADVSDPNVVLDLRNKLDATGFYDRFEVERCFRRDRVGAAAARNPVARPAQGDAGAAARPSVARSIASCPCQRPDGALPA